jgi:hypothetical protein
MRNVILSVLFVIVILFSKVEVYTQTALAKEKSCQPSTEEILSLIKSAFNALPNDEKVLVAGELKAGSTYLHIPEGRPLTLNMAIAMMGGLKKEGPRLIYVIRQSANDETRNKLEFNYDNIKKGRTKDLVLEKGDVVFVPRGCSDGKLLQPKTQMNQYLVSPIYQ